MTTLTLDHVSEFLTKRVGPALRKSASVQEDLRKRLANAEHKLAEYGRMERIAKIASKLEDKGQFTGQALNERINYVTTAAERLEKEGQSLDTLETAADMLGRDGSFGTVSEKVGSGDSEANFIAAILSGR